MSARPARPLSSVAGAGVAPATLLALLLGGYAVPSAAAARTEAPPAVVTAGSRSLRELAEASTVIAEGTVTATDRHDGDRLQVYHLTVERGLRSIEAGQDLAIVELRGGSRRPELLADGRHVVVLLRPAPPLSYLDQHLPPGARWEPVGGRDGIVTPASDAERRELARIFTEVGPRIAALHDEAAIRAARRALAFGELDTGGPRLAADALTELRGVDPLDPLSPAEVAVLEKVLASASVAPQTRIGLVDLVAARDRREALPALRRALVDTPAVLRALLSARTRLGAPPDRRELDALLAAKDPAIRASAVEALAGLEPPPVADIGRLATGDPDVAVRVTAIEALGRAGAPSALPTLAQTFASSDRDVRQASGRAIRAIGGEAANDAFVNLALHGADTDTRKYAALLLLLTTGPDSPAVRRLIASNPSGEVRELVEHGLQWHHSHQHEAE